MGLLAQDVSRVWRLQECTPDVQDLLDHMVDLGVEVGHKTTRRAHRPVEDGVDGQSDEAHAVLPLTVRRGRHEDVVQRLQHVTVVADLWVAAELLVVTAVLRDFLEHGLEEHEEARVGLDDMLELLQDRMEGLGVLVDAFYNVREPFFVVLVICWGPFPESWVVSILLCEGEKEKKEENRYRSYEWSCKAWPKTTSCKHIVAKSKKRRIIMR